MSTERFRISSELKNVIGQDLITDDFVAIFELVKNSFDADASSVHIIFDFKSEMPCIHVVDNGKGMSNKDIRDKWLFLGFSAKKEGTEDEVGIRGRHYAGNKGVGRFSCDRLGQLLHLEAKAKTGPVNVVDIDWREFERNAKNEFGDIEVNLSQQERFSLIQNYSGFMPERHGVVLSISRLRAPESWTYEKLQKLKRALSKLLDPFDGQMSHRKIFIDANKYLEKDAAEESRARSRGEEPFIVNGLVGNPLYEILKGKTTSLHATISNEQLRVRLEDRGTFIYETEEAIAPHFSLLANIAFDASIAYLNQSAKVTFSRRMGITPISFGSVFLVKNGFRVYPIGEENNDFWGIDHRKQQGYNRYLGSRELLGRVKFVSDDDTMFKESSSRDKGLIDSPALFQLKECIVYLIRKLEAFVAGISWRDKADKNEESSTRLQLDVNKARLIKLVTKLSLSKDITIIDYNHDLVSLLDKRSLEYEESLDDLRNIALQQKDKTLLCRVEKALSRLVQAKKEVEEANRIAQAEQNARMLAESDAAKSRAKAKAEEEIRKKTERELREEQKRNVLLVSEQSRGTEFYECFIHDIAGDLTAARMSLEDVLTEFRSVYSPHPDFAESLFDLMEQIEEVQALSRFAISGNFRFDAEKVDGDLVKFFRIYIERIAKVCHRLIRISFLSKIEKAMATFKPAAMGVVIDNLVNNAQKANAESIVFTLTDAGSVWEINVEDDGIGFASSVDIARIFEKGYSRTDGSGLGLFFCKKMLSDIQGDIILSPMSNKNGARFTVKVPKL